jgi:hypothetical protein
LSKERQTFAGLEDMRMGFVDGLAKAEVTGGNGCIAAMLGRGLSAERRRKATRCREL